MSTQPGGLTTLRMKVVTTFVRRVIVLVRSLEDDRSDFPLPSGLRLAILDGLDATDLAAYRALRPDESAGLLDTRFAQGDRCFAVLTGRRMVHATWASPACAPLPYLAADAALENGDVCLYDSFTDRAWRGR